MRKLFASRPHFNGFVFQTSPTEKQERKAQYLSFYLFFICFLAFIFEFQLQKYKKFLTLQIIFRKNYG